MALLKANIFVQTSGKKRHMIAIRENTKGDVYITIRGGQNIEMDITGKPKILEVRVSIHPTRDSPTSNMLKLQRLDDTGRVVDKVAFTDAIKRFPGRFAVVSSSRFTSLKSTYHDFAAKYESSGYKNIDFGNFDPEQSTATIGLLVGSRGLPFVSPNCARLETSLYQLVFFRKDVNTPASNFGKTLFHETFDPAEISADDFRRDFILAFNQGSSPRQCEWWLDHDSLYLGIDHIKTIRSFFEQAGEPTDFLNEPRMQLQRLLSEHMKTGPL
ncbi:hypothetical protein SAMN05444159_7449 [Bradyrhizobium lablabi]|uniref:Uncharacterized protein n=1 Tax=Bradyrhizobium lablabi TaxID=722472 RepID=A0A1M7FBJ0_9BRAD|nr:hypothetical protein [Bradyrhizobium lablabi]SHM01370.1 hypothetical protein SAMN05444159_7449 [Bradyrhizobium lablabi]